MSFLKLSLTRKACWPVMGAKALKLSQPVLWNFSGFNIEKKSWWFFVTSFVLNTMTFVKLKKLSWAKFRKKREKSQSYKHIMERLRYHCVVPFSTSKNSHYKNTVTVTLLESMNQSSKCILCYQIKWPEGSFFLINAIQSEVSKYPNDQNLRQAGGGALSILFTPLPTKLCIPHKRSFKGE